MSPRIKYTRLRKISTAILVALTVVTVLAAAAGTWSRTVLLNTDAYMEIVEPLGRDPRVIEAMSVRMSKEIVTVIDLETRIRNALPDEFRFLVLSVTNAARGELQNLLTKLMETEQYQQLWVSANRVTHQTIARILRNDLRYFDTPGGTVTVDLVLLATDALREVGNRIPFLGKSLPIPEIGSHASPAEVRTRLGQTLGIEIPESFGKVTILQSEKLEAAQQAIVAFDRLVVFLVVLAIVFALGTIAVSTDRDRILIILGLGMVFAVIFTQSIAKSVARDVLAGIHDPVVGEAVVAIFQRVGASVFSVTQALLVGGILLATVAFVAGDLAASRAMRASIRGWYAEVRRMAPEGVPKHQALDWVAQHSTALRVGGFVVAGLALIAFTFSWGTLALVVLVLVLFQVAVSLLTPPRTVPADAETDERRAASVRRQAHAPNPRAR